MARRPSRPTTGTSHKPGAPQPEQQGYAAWQALAASALQQTHDIALGTIPARIWRHAYVKGLTPEAAAKEAAVSAHNVRSAGDRVRQNSKK